MKIHRYNNSKENIQRRLHQSVRVLCTKHLWEKTTWKTICIQNGRKKEWDRHTQSTFQWKIDSISCWKSERASLYIFVCVCLSVVRRVFWFDGIRAANRSVWLNLVRVLVFGTAIFNAYACVCVTPLSIIPFRSVCSAVHIILSLFNTCWTGLTHAYTCRLMYARIENDQM